MRPKAKIMDVHQVFQEFADGTSMHGVPRIINARSITARVFWSVICLGAFGMFFWQCGILLQRYYSYPKKVNVEILQKPVPFPAVSVCNVGHMDYKIAASLAEELRRSLGLNYGDNYSMEAMEDDNNTDYYYDFDGTDPAMYESMMDMMSASTKANNQSDFISSYMDFMYNALSFLPAYSVFYSNTDFSIEALSRLALPANLGVDVTSRGGVKLRDFIINCRFMDDKCNITKSFEQIFDPYYFNCFTFNPEHILPSRSMRLRGVDYGLSLLLFTGSAGQVPKASLGMGMGESNRTQEAFFLPGVEESDSALASGRGARVVVHSPDTRPFPTAEGYDVPPGFSVTIGVKVHENVRIGNPHGNCTTDNMVDSTTGKVFKYTLISCQNECIQRRIMNQCRCVDNRLSIPSDRKGLPFCFQLPENISPMCVPMQNLSVVRNNPYCADVIHAWQTRMQCRRQVYDDMTIHKPEAMEECLCYPPCNDMEYDSSYSLSTLPDDPEENTAFYVNINQYTETLESSKKELLANKFGGYGKIKKGIMKHLSRLNVHIADNNIMKTTESPDYEAIRLVSDIGGQLGLWIGISVMTLFEVLQLIADVFRYLTAKGRHVGEKINIPNTISGAPMKRSYGNGDRFRHNQRDIELTCEIDKLTTV